MASTHIARISAGGVNDRRIAHSLYGYCTTAAATVMKQVSLYTGSNTDTDESWSNQDLFHGLTIKVRFQHTNLASNPTLNVNNTGALPIVRYGTIRPSTSKVTSWADDQVVTFTYDSLLFTGGCWIIDHGYRVGNDNTIGYQIRTNSMSLPMSSDLYRHRILFTSADGTHFVPANNSNSTSTTTEKAVNQEKIDPFGQIVVYATTTTVAAENKPGPTYLWHQYTVSFGYSFNTTGGDLTLTPWTPVYIKCTPQSDGSAIIDPETPYVQELPFEKDGKIYIFFGVAYNAGAVQMFINHPVYYHDGNKIKLWTGESKDYSSYIENEISGGLASFSDGANNIPIKSLIVDISPTQSGSDDPSSTNIRPINGWNNAKIKKYGKNLLPKREFPNNTAYGVTSTNLDDGDGVHFSGTANGSTSSMFNIVGFTLPAGTYSMIGIPSTYARNLYVRLGKDTVGGSLIKALSYDNNTFTLSETTTIGVRVYINSGITVDTDVYLMVVRSDEKDYAFEPYQEKIYEIAFPSIEGTVYSGKLNVTTGELTVDGLLYTFGSSDSYSYVARSGSSIANIRATPINTGDFARRSAMISNQYKTITTGATTDKAIRLSSNGATLIVYDSRFTDEETAHAITAANPIQVFYPIADPITYQLTPTEITTLLGDNNIWADTGDIEIVYRADTKKYIENLTAPDDNMIADANIPSGKYFMINNALYLSTAAITSGEAIVPGTNCTLTNLAEALNALNV